MIHNFNYWILSSVQKFRSTQNKYVRKNHSKKMNSEQFDTIIRWTLSCIHNEQLLIVSDFIYKQYGEGYYRHLAQIIISDQWWRSHADRARNAILVKETRKIKR